MENAKWIWYTDNAEADSYAEFRDKLTFNGNYYYAIKDEDSIKKGTVISTVFAIVVAGGCYFLGGFGRLYGDMPGVVSEDGTNFTDIWFERFGDKAGKTKAYSLADYSGKELYFGFRHYKQTDGGALCLDNVKLVTDSQITPEEPIDPTAPAVPDNVNAIAHNILANFFIVFILLIQKIYHNNYTSIFYLVSIFFSHIDRNYIKSCFLYLFKTTALVFIGSLFMMSGYLMGMAVFGAMLRDYTPQNRAGMFQGLRIVGQVLVPGIIGPWIGALVLRNADKIINDDGTASFIPNANIFLAALIAACFIWIILAVIFKLTNKVKED